MEKLTFTTDIKASAESVYESMLGLKDVKTYEQWTATFNPTSTYEGNWEKGSKILFVGVDGNGKRGGMVSEVVENNPAKFVSIRHYGYIDGDKEVTEGEEVEKWAGGHENYTFEENNGVTKLTVHMDSIEEYVSYFQENYPKALEVLKSTIEN